MPSLVLNRPRGTKQDNRIELSGKGWAKIPWPVRGGKSEKLKTGVHWTLLCEFSNEKGWRKKFSETGKS